MSYEIQRSIIENYNISSNYQSSLRAGNFQSLDGTNNMGFPIGNVKPFVSNCVDAFSDILVGAQPLVKNEFISLFEFKEATSGVSYINGVGLEFDSSRQLEFHATGAFSIIVSSYSLWGQPQTSTLTGVLDSGIYKVKTPQGIKILTSVKCIETADGNSINFDTLNSFELPFYDNSGAKLLNVITNQTPEIFVENQPVTPYYTTWNFNLISSSNSNTANVRPLIDFSNTYLTGINFTQFTSLQIVEDYGYSLNINFLNLPNPYPNELIKVIGIEPFSENFSTWKG